MKIEGRLLLFDVVHPDGSLILSDCKIDIPKKVPIVKDFKMRDCNSCIGSASVSIDEKGLIFTGDIPDDFITDEYPGCGGYYVNVISEPTGRLFLNSKRKITNMALKSISLLKNRFIDEYTFKKKENKDDL